MIRTRAALRRFCPSTPTLGMIRCRAYLLTSSRERSGSIVRRTGVFLARPRVLAWGEPRRLVEHREHHFVEEFGGGRARFVRIPAGERDNVDVVAVFGELDADRGAGFRGGFR